MFGSQCLTFDYHMYGSTMSCVVVYLRQKDSSVLKPLWVKSADRGNKWHKATVSIEASTLYQVIPDVLYVVRCMENSNKDIVEAFQESV